MKRKLGSSTEGGAADAVGPATAQSMHAAGAVRRIVLPRPEDDRAGAIKSMKCRNVGDH